MSHHYEYVINGLSLIDRKEFNKRFIKVRTEIYEGKHKHKAVMSKPEFNDDIDSFFFLEETSNEDRVKFDYDEASGPVTPYCVAATLQPLIPDKGVITIKCLDQFGNRWSYKITNKKITSRGNIE